MFPSFVTEGILDRHDNPSETTDQPKIEYLPKRLARREMFADTELVVLERVIGECAKETGNSLSERTHREPAWLLVWNPEAPNQRIPYGAFRWVENLPDNNDLQSAKVALGRPHTQRHLARLTGKRATR